eukprot:TRINITY_DN42311_c0_g1_i2.p1 TRINITY_DN42311_c0_g1~~TRINITY_DN42311_c0_g1_i2.p1  ORF type:complete len:264 (-),score=49.95 TRINITY_DN42311_c0_g1_i2:213-1004(-)
MLWMALKIVHEIHIAVSDSLSRRQADESRRRRSFGRPKGLQLAMNARNLMSNQSQGGALDLRPELPPTQKFSIRQWLSDTFQSTSALFEETAQVRFDTQTGDLVLGLHPATYMNDPRLSAYARRQLAKLGPFLTDEEREYIAMGLRDALVHVINQCDTNKVHNSMLEFLIRTTFVWKYQKRLLMSAATFDARTESSAVLGGTPLDEWQELFFDPVVYKEGMSAEDFQAELERITTMAKEDVEALLEAWTRRGLDTGEASALRV